MLRLMSLNRKPPYFYFTRGNNSCLLSSCGRELEGSTFSNTFSTNLSICRFFLLSEILDVFNFWEFLQLKSAFLLSSVYVALSVQIFLFGRSTKVPLCFPSPPPPKKNVDTCIYYRFHFYSLYSCHLTVFLFLYSLFPLEIPLFCKIVGSGDKHTYI